MRLRLGVGCAWALLVLGSLPSSSALPARQTAPAATPAANGNQPEMARQLLAGRQSLAGKQFAEAKRHFREALHLNRASLPARMGLADAELALHEYESAELDYRRVVAAEPQMWVAHKNLVIVEAALGRWEEFDRERAVLRGARERHADGISAHESDVIDGFTVAGRHWIVREYFEPMGRSEARYNFECFGADGRAAEYISLEPAEAAKAALAPEGEVHIGAASTTAPASGRYALNWYTGKAHGLIRMYGSAEPDYERVRADVLHWLRAGAAR